MKLILAACAAALTGAAAMVAITPAPAAPPAGKVAAAKVIIVKMLDAGPDGAMSFSPGFVKANVGDTVRFVPANATHNAETMASILPAGVSPSVGGMGQTYDLKLTVAGIYGVKCKPHYAMGMVALIQAGNGPSANLDQAKAAALPPFAKKRMAIYLAKAN